MDVRRRRIAPVIGGVTAAAAAAGAIAPATQVAVAAPDHQTGAQSPLGLAQEGTFESCSAYFGFGKYEGAGGIVAFDVADVDGNDGTDHAVPDDVQIVLVVEGDSGDTIECTPEQITSEDWETWLDDIEFFNGPAWPPPGEIRFAYPSVESGIELDELGRVTSVHFRVVGVPAGHTLVSPTGAQPLPELYPFTDSEDPFEINPALTALIEDEVGADAVSAYTAGMNECAEADPELEGSDPNLLAALQAILDFTGSDRTIEGSAVCADLDVFSWFGSFALGTLAGYEQVLPIRLSAPAQETTTTTTTTTAAPTSTTVPPSGARPVTAAPSYTG